MNQQFVKQITEMNKDGESRIFTMLRGSGIQLLLLFAVLLSPFFFSSCSDIDCPVTNGVSAKYVLKGDSLHDTLTISAIRDGLTDTVLVNRLVGSKVMLVQAISCVLSLQTHWVIPLLTR